MARKAVKKPRTRPTNKPRLYDVPVTLPIYAPTPETAGEWADALVGVVLDALAYAKTHGFPEAQIIAPSDLDQIIWELENAPIGTPRLARVQ